MEERNEPKGLPPDQALDVAKLIVDKWVSCLGAPNGPDGIRAVGRTFLELVDSLTEKPQGSNLSMAPRKG